MSEIKTIKDVLEHLGGFKEEFDINPNMLRSLSQELEKIPSGDVWKGINEIRILFPLYEALKLEGVAGKQVLDIGCGSRISTFYDVAEPWLARILQAYGANVVGLDIRDSPNETYEHIQSDLVRNRLDQIVEGGHFDFVIAKDFFNSPTLLDDPNSQLKDYNRGQLEQFFQNMSMQVFNILNTGGVYIPEFIDEKGEEILREIGFKIESSRYSKGTEPTVLARKIKYIKME